MMAKFYFVSGALLNALGIILGAFGAHFLKARLQPEELTTYETAVRYLIIHALGLIIISMSNLNIKITGVLFITGIFLFSGSLLALIFTKIRALGMITPIGGLCFIMGWLMLALRAWKQNG